jgi:predicted amidophosphoribosyltransferase
MFCMKCGTELPDEARFCLSCGTPVGGAASFSETGSTVLELTCPSCAGRLQVSPDRKEFRCEHCGKGLVVVPHEQTVTLKLKPPRKERCEFFVTQKGGRSQWVAEVYTRAGRQVIARSDWGSRWSSNWNPSGCAQVEAWLLREGWEKVGSLSPAIGTVWERWVEE